MPDPLSAILVVIVWTLRAVLVAWLVGLVALPVLAWRSRSCRPVKVDTDEPPDPDERMLVLGRLKAEMRRALGRQLLTDGCANQIATKPI